MITAAPAFVAAQPAGIVTLADGEPFTLIRGSHLMAGTRGATLNPGDMLETDSNNLVFIEFQNDAVIAVGPSSRLYLLPRAALPTFVLLRGWLKADIHTHGNASAFWLIGTRLGGGSRNSTLVLHARDGADELFQETGTMTLLLRDEARTNAARESRVSQFFVRDQRGNVATEPRPAAQFVASMPVAFRDPLPESLSARLDGKKVEPKLLREVTYDDVQIWLAMPRDWRAGFTTRFQPRLRDSAFISALDTHMADHPEWYLILHPPPPEEINPAAVATDTDAQPRPRSP